MSDILVIIIFIFLIIMAMVALAVSGREEGYKDGQIDAINGRRKYMLIEFHDGGREWMTEKETNALKSKYKNYKIIIPCNNSNQETK